MSKEKYFIVYTYTPWDQESKNQLSVVKLLSLKTVFSKFPIIETAFFDDLSSNLLKNDNYNYVESIRRIVGPDNEDYEIEDWLFIWALDVDNRMFQFLFQKTEKNNKDSPAALVALAPPEISLLFSKYKSDAILKTFSLLNTPLKMNFLMVLVPKGKSIAQEFQFMNLSKKDQEKLKYINQLKQMPNIKGQWFMYNEPQCPVCNSILKGIDDDGDSFFKLICPNCGYQIKK
jgi:hypothetical protein